MKLEPTRTLEFLQRAIRFIWQETTPKNTMSKAAATRYIFASIGFLVRVGSSLSYFLECLSLKTVFPLSSQRMFPD